MRVSQHFGLGRTQPTLDFLDVDVRDDTRIFIDPRALRLLKSEWGDECVSLVQNFFQTIIGLIRKGHNDRAKTLLGALREPNETHLGLSRGPSRGRGVGGSLAVDVWEALKNSEATFTGLLEDLEDTILMIEGISSDLISDITTNILREPLIHYTQDMATFYGIPLTPDVASGPLWDPQAREWYSEFVSLPMTPTGKLLLVPKVIVRSRMDYDADEYYRHYILEHLKDIEAQSNTELVRLLKDGTRRVTKKDLVKKYGRGKATIVRETRKHPMILQRYRADKRQAARPPLDHDDIASVEGTALPNWTALLDAVTSLTPGQADAPAYEKAVEALLSALFYPSLANPRTQVPIHEGRKRIDITYTNVATDGFFAWLAQHYSAPQVFVECKNYGGDPGNPELDQLIGRFSPSRGQFGILVCRTLQDKELFIQRCRDSANDDHGFIVPIDDIDLRRLVAERQNGHTAFGLLNERFERLIM